jgi:hypothetical protein
MLKVCRTEQLNLEEKEKITLMLDGFFSILTFILKGVYDKVL